MKNSFNRKMKEIIKKETIDFCNNLTNIDHQTEKGFLKKMRDLLVYSPIAIAEFISRGISSSKGYFLENIIRQLTAEIYPTEKHRLVDFVFLINKQIKVVEVKSSAVLDYKKVRGEIQTMETFAQENYKDVKVDKIFLMMTRGEVSKEKRLEKGGFEKNELYNLPRYWKEFLAPHYSYEIFLTLLEVAEKNICKIAKKREKMLLDFYNKNRKSEKY